MDNSPPPTAPPAMTKPAYDPGWNDPPMLGFSPSSTTPIAAKPKLNLNKRIAFPMQGNQAQNESKVQTSSAGLPLPFARVQQQPPPPSGFGGSQTQTTGEQFPPTLPPSTKTNVEEIQQNVTKSEESSNESIADYFEFSKTTLDNLTKDNNLLDKVKRDEINRRLEIMWSMWPQHPYKLKQKIYRIAKAIADDQFSAANDFYRALVVDHGNLCTQWAPAIRQLILLNQPEGNEVNSTSDGNDESVPATPLFYEQSVMPGDDKKSFGRVLHL